MNTIGQYRHSLEVAIDERLQYCLVAMCKHKINCSGLSCHEFIRSAYRRKLTRKGKISKAQFKFIARYRIHPVDFDELLLQRPGSYLLSPLENWCKRTTPSPAYSLKIDRIIVLKTDASQKLKNIRYLSDAAFRFSETKRRLHFLISVPGTHLCELIPDFLIAHHTRFLHFSQYSDPLFINRRVGHVI